MKEFKKPDVKAPRYRPKAYNLLNKEFFDRFKQKYPKYKNHLDSELKKIIKKFHKNLYQAVIDTRDGVELLEQIGWIFIGTCQQSKKKNVDFNKSKIYGVQVTNTNWATDGKLAKIFFTSSAPKHKLKNREFWSFIGCRDFKRSVAKAYPENWNMYVEVVSKKGIKEVYTKNNSKHYMIKKTNEAFKNYNDLEI